ncbi:MAG: hypothetical protein B7C54_01565 [Acidimicrobiales bacterium mtb01]|nr:hypothetical protein [Actinomycetota bacterium]TEX47986.1 MAG: hypothetical protein B7C54_01565 [Acidimicrobiales bacterium mtb01]
MKRTPRSPLRRVGRVGVALAIAALAAAPTQPAHAAVTDHNWWSGCGSGTYGAGGALQALAIMNTASGNCGVKAQALCQRQSGSSQWQADSTFRGLNTLSSKTCTSPYNYNRLNVGAIYLT